MNKIKEKFKAESERIKIEIGERITGYLLTAFGLVGALAWNDAVTSSIEYLFPFSKESIIIKFIYAFIITFIIVIFSVYLTKLFKNEKKI